MKNITKLTLASSILGITLSCNQSKHNETETCKHEMVKPASTPIVVNTPEEAIQELKNGNKRFLDGTPCNINYKEQIEKTKGGQKPHTIILSCMDSRVPPEIIFDQGIGNIFVSRVAGNVEDENVIGSIEYAVEHAGAKLIVVLGHSHCGAVTGAVKDVKAGHLTQLLEQIKPAIKADADEEKTINETAKNNISMTINDIIANSEIVKEMIKEKKIAIVGAFYNIETGEVVFM